MRQGIDQAAMNGEIWIEEVGQIDAIRLGYQAQMCAISVKRPWQVCLFEFESVLVVSKEHGFLDLAGLVAVYDRDRLILNPIHRETISTGCVVATPRTDTPFFISSSLAFTISPKCPGGREAACIDRYSY
jgi:hypothetical protein